MFTRVYWVIKGFFCNICREIPADIAEKPLNHPVNPCKHKVLSGQLRSSEV